MSIFLSLVQSKLEKCQWVCQQRLHNGTTQQILLWSLTYENGILIDVGLLTFPEEGHLFEYVPNNIFVFSEKLCDEYFYFFLN